MRDNEAIPTILLSVEYSKVENFFFINYTINLWKEKSSKIELNTLIIIK
jgi:hypothetical protein